jgi:hypothetical protein
LQSKGAAQKVLWAAFGKNSAFTRLTGSSFDGHVTSSRSHWASTFSAAA